MPSETGQTIATIILSAITGAGGLKLVEKLIDRYWLKGDKKVSDEASFQGQLFSASVGASEKMRGELWTRFTSLESKVEALTSQLGDAKAEIARQREVIEGQEEQIASLKQTEQAYVKLQERFVTFMLEYARSFSSLNSQDGDAAYVEDSGRGR